MSDRHNIFGEPRRGHPASPPGRPRIPFVEVKNEGDDGPPRPPRPRKRRGIHLAWLFAADVLLGALILLLFYLTTYVFVPEVQGVELTPPPGYSTATPAPPASSAVSSPTASIPVSATPTASVNPGAWGAKFADKFTNGTPIQTENSYKGKNINVKIDKVQTDGVTYFVADIYVADLKYFKTAFGVNPDTMGKTEFVDQESARLNGIVAINGDYPLDNKGLIIRNGKLFPPENRSIHDSLVMYSDGTMKTFSPTEFDIDTIKSQAPYQVWSFGPMLLKDGQPMTTFNSTVKTANPRTAIGYFEPGHYCFVVVDGRQPGYSTGYTMTQLSQLFSSLGCKAAYNLDGGGSSQIAFNGTRINKPCSDFRKVSDMLYITDQ